MKRSVSVLGLPTSYLATLRERAAAAEQRATDLASQLQRQQLQSEREIAQLRVGQARSPFRRVSAHGSNL